MGDGIKGLVGYKNFKRHNPMTDRFEMGDFHHFEFWCQDASNASKRFAIGLGMQQIARSDQTTGNHHFASYVMKSHDVILTFSAPYSRKTDKTNSKPALPVDIDNMHEFNNKHGVAVRAVGVTVKDAAEAYRLSTENGGIGVTPPITLEDSNGKVHIAEIVMYGDVVLRFVQFDGYTGPYLPGYVKDEGMPLTYGIRRFDHAVGNVPVLLDQVNYFNKALGWHEFAEFTTEDVGTVDSGLNSMVMANNNEYILLPVNEPTFGTKRKSQIQTFLEQNEGAGLQHIAVKTDNIFETMRMMRKMSFVGGFEFMPRPSEDYFKNLPNKIGDSLTPEQYKEVEELGLLVDKDDQGVLLQIFTKPIGDRPTIFFEIIERVGCMIKKEEVVYQAAGCGGFGKGNFSELFKSIEDYEKTLDGTVNAYAC